MTMMMNKTVPVEAGCYIDGSHRDSIEFSLLVVEMAHEYGFELDWDRFVKDAANLREPGYMMEEDELNEILDALDWTYEDALDYLNDNTRPEYVWVVRDQSLFLMTGDEADD
jgi:hypothetical protein